MPTSTSVSTRTRSARSQLGAAATAACVWIAAAADGGLPAADPRPVADEPRPSWRLISGQAVGCDEARDILRPGAATKPRAARARGLPLSETEVTDAVTGLADALDNDPALIFDYVYNRIEYVPMFGSTKTAEATVLAGRGSDCDQATLFIALMRAAGYTADYVVGDVVYESAVVADWLGVNDDKNIISAVLASGGIPHGADPAGIGMTRVWAQAEIDGTTYVFDPAMKEHNEHAGIDLTAATGYDRTAFLQRARQGAAVDADSVADMNETNVWADLADFSTALVQQIRDTLPEATLTELIGGKTIEPASMTSYPTALPRAVAVLGSTVYAQIPDAYRHKLRIRHEGIDQTFHNFEIAGLRITIRYASADGAPELRVEGELIETGNPLSWSTWYPLVVSVDHPYAAAGGTYADQEATLYGKRGATYVLLHDFEESSPALLARRNARLQAYRQAGQTDDSEAVLGETLAVFGMTWALEEGLFNRILGPIAHLVTVQHHRVGLVGQESGYYIDTPLLHVSAESAIGNAGDRRRAMRTRSLMSSALEHGILEQQQGTDKPAVSTIKVLQLNNANGDETFHAHAGNWSAVETQLVNYASSQLNYIGTCIGQGYQFILPERGDVSLNAWRGFGYVQFFEAGSSFGMGMIIYGALYGGSSSMHGDADPDDLLDPDSIDEQGDKEDPEDADPVHMATGVFLCHKTDIALGSKAPLGLHLRRSYNSGRNTALGPLGYGWRHNYSMAARRHSDGPAGLGLRRATDAASMVAAAHVMHDLTADGMDLPTWMTATLAAKWGMDQLLDNAVTVSAVKSLAFIELADGSFEPPPGIAAALVDTGSGYAMIERSGSRFNFRGDGLITDWSDANGNTMTFSYDSSNRLHRVTDAFGGRLTFGYNGFLTSYVTDSSGRWVRYHYSDGNLVAFEDAEHNMWRYAYDDQNRMTEVYAAEPPGTKGARDSRAAEVMTAIAYNDEGRVIAQTNGLGHVTTLAWSNFRNTMHCPDGGSFVYFFDEDGRQTAQQDPLTNRAYLAYNRNGQCTSRTDRLGYTSFMQYDAESGQLAEYRNALGHALSYSYGPRGTATVGSLSYPLYSLERIDYPDGSSERFFNDEHGNATARVDRAGGLWRYGFDDHGMVTGQTNPAGGVVTYTYTNGLVAARQDTDTGLTTYEYDDSRRLERVIHPDGSAAEADYDDNDRRTSVTDEKGSTYSYAYDASGNLLSVAAPDGHTAHYAYNVLNWRTQVIDRVGHAHTMTYDSMGRLQELHGAHGVTVRFGNNPRGGLDTLVQPGGYTHATMSDAEGGIVAEERPDGSAFTYVRDALGQVQSVTDPLGNTRHASRNAMNRVTNVVTATGIGTAFEMGGDDWLVGVSQPALGSAAMERDDLGALARLTDPNGNDWTFGRTPMGRLTAFTDPLSNRWQYALDALGRATNTTYPDGATLRTAYDPAGNVTGLHSSCGASVSRSHDSRNRLSAVDGISLAYDAEDGVTNTCCGTVNFGALRDLAGRVESVSYDDGLFTASYTYNDRDCVTRVSDTLSGAWIEIDHDALGRATALRRSNGLDARFTYDAAGRLVRIEDGGILDLVYELDADGRVIREQRETPLSGLDGVASALLPLAHDAACRIDGSGYSYDSRGRTTQSPDHTFAWDGFSRLVGVDDVQLEYDGLRRLAVRTEGGVSIRYEYNYALPPMPLVAERNDTTGQALRYYVWLPVLGPAYVIDAQSGNSPIFYHFDRHGSTVALTDAAGTVTDAYAYSPYGRVIARVGSSPQPFTFLGRHGVRQEGADGELFQMPQRCYDAVAGRFLSREPFILWPQVAELRELNPYQYAGLDPVNFVDVTGLDMYEVGTDMGCWFVCEHRVVVLETGMQDKNGQRLNYRVEAPGPSKPLKIQQIPFTHQQISEFGPARTEYTTSPLETFALLDYFYDIQDKWIYGVHGVCYDVDEYGWQALQNFREKMAALSGPAYSEAFWANAVRNGAFARTLMQGMGISFGRASTQQYAEQAFHQWAVERYSAAARRAQRDPLGLVQPKPGPDTMPQQMTVGAYAH